MNPIHVNCPQCQKLFMVSASDLSAGQARFRCTSCNGLFAFNWPQPPEVTTVTAQALDSSDFVQANPPQVEMKPLQTCVRCGEKSDAQFAECPKCGVVFNKVRKIGPPQTGLKANTAEIANAWEEVRAQYADEKRHEKFIRLCLNFDNLAYASNQYRAILMVNPSEELANKMQARIVELAAAAYLSTRPPTAAKRKIGVIAIIMFMGFVFIGTGLLLPQVRSLIAVGSSFIAFAMMLQFWIVKAD